MRYILITAALLLVNMQAAIAQDNTELAENSSIKSQQQIMDEYNNRSNVSLKFYPNPAINYMVVEPQLNAEAGEIRIMDIAGRVRGEYHLEAGSNGMTIDVVNYQSGMYIITLYDNNNRLLYVSRFNKGE